jgi:TonB family protein
VQAGIVFALASSLGTAAVSQGAAQEAAQEAAQPAAPSSQSSTSQTIPKPGALPPLVAGAPYSAEEHRVRTRMLEDGTRITENWPVQRKYRDTQGRTRVDRPLLTSPDAPELPRIVEIDDPGAGLQYILEPSHKIAHRFRLPPIPPAPDEPEAPTVVAPPSIAFPAPAGSKTEMEDLGAWVIEGFRAEGVRRTIRIPTGKIPAGAVAVGEDSDRSLVIVEETWTAPELQIVVREKLYDPRRGESTTELLKIRGGEPAAGLFQVPPDYRIVDEARDFTIPFVTHGHPSAPLVITRPQAKYTDEARRNGIQGIVLLSAVVDESGKAQDIRVEHSIDPGLDQEAIKAVRRWRFRPGEQDGRPVRVPVHVEITFRLND